MRSRRGRAGLGITLAIAAAVALPALAAAAPGDIYVSEPFSGGTHGAVVRVNPANGAQSILAQDVQLPVTDVQQLAFEPGGNVLVAVSNGSASDKIVRVNVATGAQSIVASGGDIEGVYDVAVAPGGAIIAAGSNGKITSVNPANGSQTPVVSISNDLLRGVDVAPNGDIFVMDASVAQVKKVSGGVATNFGVGTTFSNPQGLARGANGDIFVANRGGSNILRIPASGAAGAEYVGGAPFNEPVAVAFSPMGDLYATDISPGGGTPPGVVKITPAKNVSVLPKGTKLQDARGIAIDTSATADKTVPAIASASLSNSTFAVDKQGQAAARRKRAPKGTTISYTLSEAATVTFTVEKKGKGRRVKGKCRKQTRKNRKRSTRYTGARSFTQAGKAGKNTKLFSGKIGTKSLKPGSYRMTLVARDAAKNVSKSKTLNFKIVR